MPSPPSCWLGVDVGAKRKAFDVALVDDRRLLHLEARMSLAAVVSLAERKCPAVIGIDSPCRCAPDGLTARAAERQVSERICGIRWTPDAERVHASDYYAWIVQGLALFQALAGHRGELIEVFPTASWTRWIGKRATRSRARWTHEGLAKLGVGGVPKRTNQDQRDAIAAAVTARQHDQGATEMFGEIVVPVRDAL